MWRKLICYETESMPSYVSARITRVFFISFLIKSNTMKLQNWAADIVELQYKTFLKYLFFDIRCQRIPNPKIGNIGGTEVFRIRKTSPLQDSYLKIFIFSLFFFLRKLIFNNADVNLRLEIGIQLYFYLLATLYNGIYICR